MNEYDEQHPIPFRVRVKLQSLARGSIKEIWRIRNKPMPGFRGRPWEGMWDDITLIAREVLEETNG